MELLLLLISAHFIADFYLQPTAWIACRNRNHWHSAGLWKHISVHTSCYTFLLLFQDITASTLLTSTIILGATHLLTDLWKSYQPLKLRFFILDQSIHLFVILLVWIQLSDVQFVDIYHFIKTLITPKTLLFTLAYVLVCKPASILIQHILSKYAHNITETNTGLDSAGTWIGYLERSLAITFIFAGQFAGIGVLVATKTIFRFGDLTRNKDMKLTEYMMLGTLFSFSIALVIGWSTLYLTK